MNKKHMRQSLYKLLIFIFVPIFAIASIPKQTVSAQSECDYAFYSGNDVMFNDPCDNSNVCVAGGGDLTAAAPTELQGNTNPERVWNYFIARGLTPIAAAGAMGNMEQESSAFDPWAGENGNKSINKELMGVGFGIIQWTNTDNSPQGRRYGVMNYLETNGVSLNATDATQNDKALLYELNWLWDGEYGNTDWQKAANAETTVDGNASIDYSADNTGNGSAMVFHKLVERSGDDTKGKQERIDSAKAFLEKFGGSTGAGSCPSSIGNSGLTLEQAKAFMMRYGENVNGFSQKMANKSGYNSWGECGGNGANCVTFSQFFNTAFTDMPVFGYNNGYKVVSGLANHGVTTGSEPKLFATFSAEPTPFDGYGHTGIILGIQGDTLIIGQANCFDGRGQNGRPVSKGAGDGTREGRGSGFVMTGVITANVAYMGENPTGFAYPNTVDTAAILEFIEKGYVDGR